MRGDEDARAVGHQDHGAVDVRDDPVEQAGAGLQAGLRTSERGNRPDVGERRGEPGLPVVLDVTPEARDQDDGRVAHRVAA